MGHLQKSHSTYNHVFAVFESSGHSFDMPRGASFADLADWLAQKSERHKEGLIRIEVTTGTRHRVRGTSTAGLRLHWRPVGVVIRESCPADHRAAALRLGGHRSGQRMPNDRRDRLN